MAANQPRLTGIGKGRTRRGRHQRGIDKLAAQLRDVGDYDDHQAALVTTARGLAASLDRLEDDDDRSEHTIATVARVLLDVLRELRPTDDGSHDPFDWLTDDDTPT